MEKTSGSLNSSLIIGKELTLTVVAEKQMTFIQLLHEAQRKIIHLNKRILTDDEIVNSEAIKNDIDSIGKKNDRSSQIMYFFKVTVNGVNWK